MGSPSETYGGNLYRRLGCRQGKGGIKEHKVEEEGVLEGKMILGRGEGSMEEHVGAAGNSLPRSRSLL